MSNVASQDDVEMTFRADDVARACFDRNIIFSSVECDGDESEGVDVIGRDMAGAGFCCGYRARPQPEAKSSTRLPATSVG